MPDVLAGCRVDREDAVAVPGALAGRAVVQRQKRVPWLSGTHEGKVVPAAGHRFCPQYCLIA